MTHPNPYVVSIACRSETHSALGPLPDCLTAMGRRYAVVTPDHPCIRTCALRPPALHILAPRELAAEHVA